MASTGGVVIQTCGPSFVPPVPLWLLTVSVYFIGSFSFLAQALLDENGLVSDLVFDPVDLMPEDEPLGSSSFVADTPTATTAPPTSLASCSIM